MAIFICCTRKLSKSFLKQQPEKVVQPCFVYLVRECPVQQWYNDIRINQTLRTQGRAAVVTVCKLQYLQNAVAKKTPSAAAWSCSMDKNRRPLTKTIFMPPSLYLLIDPNESDKIVVMSATKFCRYTRGNLKSKQ